MDPQADHELEPPLPRRVLPDMIAEGTDRLPGDPTGEDAMGRRRGTRGLQGRTAVVLASLAGVLALLAVGGGGCESSHRSDWRQLPAPDVPPGLDRGPLVDAPVDAGGGDYPHLDTGMLFPDLVFQVPDIPGYDCVPPLNGWAVSVRSLVSWGNSRVI